MIEIAGAYARAIIYTDQLEQGARAQIEKLLDQPFVKGATLRMMPDVHAGAGCVIGTTMTIRDKIVPNLVGVDIGCGMETVPLEDKRIDYAKLDSLIKARIPAGMKVRDKAHGYADQIDLGQLRAKDKLNLDRGYLSIGTLGGGNHFIEVDQDDAGNLYLVVHSGSRHLGLEVAQYYQNAAWEQRKGDGADKPPYELCYLEGDLFGDYLNDMALVQRFAHINRQAMAKEIVKGMRLTPKEPFTTVHNYIDTGDMVLRKGAVSARAGEKLLIPINMRDGSLLCTGKGNEAWNQSAPHGAGRLMSRKQAKDSFTLNQFKKEMQGVFTTTVAKDTLDECPMAYKSMDHILKNIGPTAQVDKVIKPKYNFKAGE